MSNLFEGQLEATISRSFTKTSNLRALLLKEGCPLAIANCHKIFAKLVDPQIRNSLLTDISHFLIDNETDELALEVKLEKVTVPEAAFRALQVHFQGKHPPVAKVLSSYTLDGLTFSTFKRHRGNSHILVRCAYHTVPARIEEIIQTSSNDVLFVVQHFHKAASKDPFQKYPVLQTSIWSDNLGRHSR